MCLTGKDDSGLASVEHVLITSIDQGVSLLDTARRRRATGATKCNEHSSRSHLIVRLVLASGSAGGGKDTSSIASSGSIVNLVDLAGSERCDESGVAAAALTVRAAPPSSGFP